jgi:hypothetical protein
VSIGEHNIVIIDGTRDVKAVSKEYGEVRSGGKVGKRRGEGLEQCRVK